MEGIENFIEYCNEYLTDHWEKINEIAEKELTDFLGDEFSDLKSDIVDCLTSSTKSYHYVLPTQLLSKAVEPSRDCRSIQVAYGKAGKIKEILFVAEKGIEEDKKNKINQRVKSEFNSGQNIYITNLLEFATGILILLGEQGRISFTRRIGPELDKGNSSILHRKVWANLLREI